MNNRFLESRLDELDEAYAQRDVLSIQKQELIDGATPAEVKLAILAIEAEFEANFAFVAERIGKLESAVKEAVIGAGESVKGAHVHAVYSKARVSWDAKALDGYAVAHPEINAFRTYGRPSVSIRRLSE